MLSINSTSLSLNYEQGIETAKVFIMRFIRVTRALRSLCPEVSLATMLVCFMQRRKLKSRESRLLQ